MVSAVHDLEMGGGAFLEWISSSSSESLSELDSSASLFVGDDAILASFISSSLSS